MCSEISRDDSEGRNSESSACGAVNWKCKAEAALSLAVNKERYVFFGLEKANAPRQLDLFSTDLRSPFPVSRLDRHSLGDGGSPSPLYKAIDAINARYGKGKVFSASEGIGDKSWKMKRSKLSKRASTRWDELLTVR